MSIVLAPFVNIILNCQCLSKGYMVMRRGNLALYDLCAHNLCAPPVMPNPATKYKQNAKHGTNRQL